MKAITNDQKDRVSVIGLGAMGSALARTFLQKGYQVTVWNNTRQFGQSYYKKKKPAQGKIYPYNETTLTSGTYWIKAGKESIQIFVK